MLPEPQDCHACGAVNDALALADRNWTCGCGAHHDRDLNAALNIRAAGLRLIPLAAGYAESLNARGAGVRPHQLEAVGVEPRISRL
jgi:putative transposase